MIFYITLCCTQTSGQSQLTACEDIEHNRFYRSSSGTCFGLPGQTEKKL
jgi:hypothetical protein